MSKYSKLTPTSYVSLDETSRALLDSSVESVFLMDTNGIILAANDAAAKVFGKSKGSDLERNNVFDFLPEEVARVWRLNMQDVVKKRAPVRFEDTINGRSLVHSVVPVRNPWGKVMRLAVTTLDLTELRKVDENLRREQQRQVFLMESLPGIVYHLYPDQTIRYANRYFRKYFGSPKDKDCREVLRGASGEYGGCPPINAMEMDRVMEWDWEDGKGRTFHLQCSPMTDSSGERMLMVLGIDITARKQAEDALKQARAKLEDRVQQRTRELEKANEELTRKSTKLVSAMKKANFAIRAKSAFLANMSHEIRTPLNAVLGMTELAVRSNDERKRVSYMKRAIEAGKSLLSVINDILDFSKIEAHKLTLEQIDFNLRTMLESAMDIHRIQTAAKSLFLDYNIADNVPNVFVGDPHRLKQVLINLVSNAVKFTEKGGVSISVFMADGPANPQPGDEVVVEFAVSDTGIGVPAEKKEKIFESFQQSDDSITRKYGGTGLGLSICTLLVKLMQGDIRLESEEGKGSTFTFTVKLKIGDPQSLVEKLDRNVDAEALGLTNMKVLLADDNSLNLELASTLLVEQGHEVVCVENGAQALEIVKREPFDIILMDVQMPLMDGLSATRAIRDPNSGALDPNIPIVAITAHALKGDRDRFLEAGMNDYIAKPIDMMEFYNTLSRTMQESKGASGSLEKEDAPSFDRADIFDRKGALDMLAGRKDLLARMDEIFLRDTPKDLERLQADIANRDWDEARLLAHSIKGASRTVGALRAGAEAEQMEFFCNQKDEKMAEEKLKVFEAEVKFALKHIKENMEA